jgi:hypothetical protein
LEEEDNTDYPLSFVVMRLYSHLYPAPDKKERIYTSSNLKMVLENLNILYQQNGEKNPNDAIVCVLEGLQKDIYGLENKTFMDYNFNYRDKFSLIESKKQKYQNLDRTIISFNLNWFELIYKKCYYCNNLEYDLQTYNTFTLSLEQTSNLLNKNYINIDDCLSYYIMTKNIEKYCNLCHTKTQFGIMKKIFSLSPRIIFLLDRGENYLNNNQVFELTGKINLSKYTEINEQYIIYELNGVISYSLKEQKFMCFCVSAIDNNWYLYNDEKVSRTDLNYVLLSHSNQQQKYVPYTLLYKIVDGN